MKPSLRCRIHGHRWNNGGLYYGELDCDHCGHNQSPQEPDPPYLLRPWHRFRWWCQWWPRRRFLATRHCIASLFRRITGRHDSEDDIPF